MRRAFTPIGGLIIFVLIALLVVGALGWVTVAALRVEAAQLEAIAQADSANKERLALWQLDSRLFPTLGVETNRPYAHYFATYIPYPVVLPNSVGPNVEPLQVPSPLLSAELPEWTLLHFQVDSETGWTSPQVISAELEAQLLTQVDNAIALTNATPERRELLDRLQAAFPKEDVLMTLFDRELSDLQDLPLAVPFPPTEPQPTPAPAAEEAAPGVTALSMGMEPDAVAKPRHEGTFTEKSTLDRGGAAPGQRGGMPPPVAAPAPPTANDLTANKVAETKKTPDLGLPNNNTFDTRRATRDKGLQEVQGRGANDPTQFFLKPGPPVVQDPADAAKAEKGKDVRLNGPPPPPAPTTSPTEVAPAAAAAQGAAGYGGRSTPPAAMPPTPPRAMPPADPQRQDGNKAELKKATGAAAERWREGRKSDPAEPQKAANELQAEQLAQTDERLGKAVPPTEGPTRGGIAPANRRLPHLQPPAVHLGPMRPQWLHAPDGADHLIFVRVARLEHKTVFQGVVLDWPRLQEVLQDEVRPLFPEARLEPVFAATEVSERTMTALPARLAPGPAADPQPAGWTPLRLGLAIAWVAAVVALVAVGFGGWSLIDLSERRIRFVSAVTHELRTPLTSLRLYLDLLTSGMIRDEEKQREYLTTLHGESERLNRLIENVLDFARLEKRSVEAHRQPMKLAELLDQVKQTWADRCAADGKDLVVISTLPPDQEVCTDARMAAQILGNLIDNARKYTLGAADRRIWLWAKPGGRKRVVLEVEDRGPGVPAAERCAIFRPFRRGQTADTSAGGAGLGLALAKQWAEVLGGSLTCRAADGGAGACFRLELPVR